MCHMSLAAATPSAGVRASLLQQLDIPSKPSFLPPHCLWPHQQNMVQAAAYICLLSCNGARPQPVQGLGEA